MKILFKFFHFIKNLIELKLEEKDAQYTAYGIFGLFNFPIYYFIWLYLSVQSYENLFLRICCTILCLFLALHNHWPRKFKKFLPVYWYFTLFFTLPFFFTFMLIMNHGSTMWITSTIIIVFFVILLVDWVSAIFLLSVGSIIGTIIASFFTKYFFPIGFDYFGFFTTYFVAIVIGVIFAHNREKIHEERLKGAESVASIMGHELRTPLSTISNYAQALKRLLPKIFSGYHYALEKGYRENITNSKLEALKQSHETVLNAITYTNTTIEVLTSVFDRKKYKTILNEKVDFNEVISFIKNYTNIYQNKPIDFVFDIQPFQFSGNKVIMSHILLNLIKNSIYAVMEKGAGKIVIKAESFSTHHIISIWDSGIGIPKEILRHIFDRFYSTKSAERGSGLGLYFVKKMVTAMNGSISVNSIYNESTEFNIKLPKLQE